MNIGVSLAKLINERIISKFGTLLRKAFNEKYLFYTNVGISVSLSGLGDYLEQRYEIYSKQIDTWDPIRTRTMALSGCSVGIVCHYWYNLLDRRLPGSTLRMVFKKIIVDQLIGSPLAISTFFLACGVLEGSSYKAVIEEVKEKAWKLYVAEWMIWPPAQFVNFYLLSTRHRVLFDNIVSLGYDIYTSRVKYEQSNKEDDQNKHSKAFKEKS